MKLWLLISVVLSGAMLWADEGASSEKEAPNPFDPPAASQPTPTAPPAPETVTLDIRWASGRNVLVMLTHVATDVQPEEPPAIRSEARLLLVGQLDIPSAPAVSQKASASQPARKTGRKGTFRFVRIAQRQKTNVGPIHDVSFDTDRIGQAKAPGGNVVGNLGPLGVLLDIPYTVELDANNNVKSVRGFDAYFRSRGKKPIPAMKISFGNQAVMLMLQRGRRFAPDNPKLPIQAGVQWKKTDLLNLPAHGETKMTMDYVAKRFYDGGKRGPRKLDIDSSGQINAPAGKSMKTDYGSATISDLKGHFTGNIRVTLGASYSTLLASDMRGELKFLQKMKIAATGKTVISEIKIKNAELLRVYSRRHKDVENRLFNPPRPKKKTNAQVQKAQSGK